MGVTVASVDYRLAPEYLYPAALEDCYSALTWLAGLPLIDPARAAIAGGIAGGGLAAALGLTARDRGEVSLAAPFLVYPMLDRTVGDGLDDPRHRLWTQKSNRFGWAAYLGGADPQTAVPARHADLAGLPPTWPGVGTLDLFYAEDLAYAARLSAAEVPFRTEVVEGAFHSFDLFAPKTSVARAYFTSQCDTLREAFAGG